MNWPQLRTILWLRWCLSRNQLRRKGAFGSFVSAIVGLGMIILPICTFAGGLFAGSNGFRDASATFIMGVWVAFTLLFLVLQFFGVLAELQRSESIDLQRLMHLPVSLGQIFVVNYFASHLALIILMVVPGMIGLALGLGFSRGLHMWLLVPLALSMVFMITSWTYCFRGWLATVMGNPRRRRSIIMGLTFGLILAGQAPNLYFNLYLNRARSSSPSPQSSEERQQQRAERRADKQEAIETFIAAQKYIPPLWVSYGARELANERPLPAVLGTMGLLALGALGLRRAYRSTLRFYLGETNRTEIKSSPPPDAATKSDSPAKPVKDGTHWFEHRIPGVPEQATALALATFRSMTRAPEIKMALGTPFIIMIIVGATVITRPAPEIANGLKPFVTTACMIFSLFLSVQLLANSFGFDRHGFRSLVLCPAQRRLLLLGKNIAAIPVSAGIGLLLLAGSAWWVKLPLLGVIAAVFQLLTMLALAGMAGNLISILMPIRIPSGSMKPTKMPAGKMIMMILFNLLFPLALMPAMLPPLAEIIWRQMDMPSAVPINLLLSIGLAAAAALAYWRSLEPLGRLLHRRETLVLDVVAAEVE